MNPDSDVNANNSDSNNNNSSISVNNYFDNNKFRNSRLDEPIILEDDGEEEEHDDDESGSGETVEDPDYEDYEENIEEFASSSSPSNGQVSVNSATVSPEGSSLAENKDSMTTEALSPPQEELVNPDQIRNVVDEATAAAVSETFSTATEILNDGPRTEALIGIRPYSETVQVEGSGNGRVDDEEEDDDYDDEDTDVIKARKRVKNARENAERGNSRRFNNYNGNLEEGSDEDGSSRFKNRRFGKNNAIKFISTPHGKVGILYSSSTDDAKKSNGGSSGGSTSASEVRKDVFRGISSDLRPILVSNSESRTNEDASSGSSMYGKMTPVLTADGKVALLYRGSTAENENVAKKYEPIVNYTKPVPVTQSPIQETHSEQVDESTERETNLLPKSNTFDSDYNRRLNGEVPFDGQNSQQKQHNSIGGSQDESMEFDQDDSVAPPPPPPKLEDNNFLPILDRPLSELLGLKKHQFTHFRVTEPAATTPIPQVNMRGKLPSNYDYDFGADYNGVSDPDILTKTEVVNLAIVPSVTQDTHNSVVHHKGNAHFRKHRRIRLEDLSNVHCAMQAMVGVAALACIFGMLGAYFKNRILDTQVPAYRL